MLTFSWHAGKVQTLAMVEVLEGAWVDGWGVDVASVIPFHYLRFFFLLLSDLLIWIQIFKRWWTNGLFTCWGMAGMGQKTPPQGYICHRCKVPGMLICLNFVIPHLLTKCWIPLSVCIAYRFLLTYVCRAFHSALPYKRWSKLWHQKSQATYRYSQIYADGKSTRFLCFTKWLSSCFEAKWVSASWFLSILSYVDMKLSFIFSL